MSEASTQSENRLLALIEFRRRFDEIRTLCQVKDYQELLFTHSCHDNRLIRSQRFRIHRIKFIL